MVNESPNDNRAPLLHQSRIENDLAGPGRKVYNGSREQYAGMRGICAQPMVYEHRVGLRISIRIV